MNFRKSLAIVVFPCFFFSITNAQATKDGFKVIPLGVKGGLDESNLSAYLVAANGSNNFISLDAGTINAGLQKALAQKSLEASSAEEAQKKFIKGYFISHGHLDHLAGLILNAPNDVNKPIYAFPSVIEVLKNNYFTWKSWANFANEGDKPILNKYQYQNLVAGKEIDIPNTELHLTPFSLSHVNPYESSAFLVRNNNDYLLYLGDTGADTVEKSTKLAELWTAVAPMVTNGKLKAIFIEVSFDNSMPDKALFGHLTPKLLMQELSKLNAIAAGSLKHTNIVVTHIKPCDNCAQTIQKQIEAENTIGLPIVYPIQGKLMVLK
jgi:3',5'-cyclic-nucleotide phosphodiesterase